MDSVGAATLSPGLSPFSFPAMSQQSGEFGFIDWIRKQTPADPRVVLGPGDDTAVLRVRSDVGCLATTDMLLEGSCFLLEAGGRAIGRKAMAVNLSDSVWPAGQQQR